MANSQATALKNDTPVPQAEVIVFIDGKRIPLTREQEALIRAWASGPV